VIEMSAQANSEPHAELQDVVKVIVQFGNVGQSNIEWMNRDDQARDRELDRSLKPEDLDAIRTGKIELLKHKCVLLPSRTKADVTWVPVLWAHIEGTLTFSFQVLVFASGRQGFGYRWEFHPSGPLAGGKHAHCHAQPIWEARCPSDGKPHEVFKPLSICEDIPTFPIDADSPLSLLGAMLVSLYDDDFQKHLANGELYAKVMERTARARGAGGGGAVTTARRRSKVASAVHGVRKNVRNS